MEIELADGTILDAPDGADASAVAKAYLAKQRPQPQGFVGPPAPPQIGPMGMQLPAGAIPQFGRVAGLLGRDVLNAVAGVPLMAGDFGVALGNLANRAMGTSEMELPSASFKRGLTMAGLPEPQTAPEKVRSFLDTAILGMAVPSPPATRGSVPENFVSPSQMKNSQPFVRANEAGYVVPPATVQPTFKNRMLESLGGKIATQQDAQLANTPVTENLSNRAFMLPEGRGPITTEDLSAIRQSASPAYEALKDIGTVKADQEYLSALAKIGASRESAARTFGGPFAENSVKPYLEALAKEDIPAADAIDATKVLRELADKNFAGGDKATGNAFKQASNALEWLLERRGLETGPGGAVDMFRGARKLIAQTYSAEKAVNDAAGTFSPRVLAAQIKRGVPLEGPLRTIGEFSARFPKISEPLLESPTRYTDAILPAGLAMLSGNPAPLAIPLTRDALRAYLLSPQYQRQIVQSMTQPQGAGMPLTAEALRSLMISGNMQ